MNEGNLPAKSEVPSLVFDPRATSPLVTRGLMRLEGAAQAAPGPSTPPPHAALLDGLRVQLWLRDGELILLASPKPGCRADLAGVSVTTIPMDLDELLDLAHSVTVSHPSAETVLASGSVGGHLDKGNLFFGLAPESDSDVGGIIWLSSNEDKWTTITLFTYALLELSSGDGNYVADDGDEYVCYLNDQGCNFTLTENRIMLADPVLPRGTLVDCFGHIPVALATTVVGHSIDELIGSDYKICVHSRRNFYVLCSGHLPNEFPYGDMDNVFVVLDEVSESGRIAICWLLREQSARTAVTVMIPLY